MKSSCFIDSTPLLKAGLTPSQCTQISEIVRKWIRSCGPEWTVARLKEFKMIHLYRVIGREYPSQWISLRGGLPSGPFRPLFTGGTSYKRVRRVFDALMIYTGIRITESKPTAKQRKKFFDSMEAEDIPISTPVHYRRAMDEIRSLTREVTFERLTYHVVPLNGKKSSCDVLGRSAPNYPERIADDFRTSVIWDLLDDPDINDVLMDTLGPVYRLCFRKVDEDTENNYIGRISVIQEKGCKARFIAIPRMVPQLGLLSLGRYLLKVIERVPWDCTHDQTAGPEWGLTQLREGKRLWSIDLSDFTNHWPLSFIEKCLHDLRLIPTGDLRLFHETAIGYYLYDLMPKRWKRGQPLGTYASFPAAALSHGVLLRCCEMAIGVRNTFRVLGDDVLISNSEVCDLYLAYLQSWNIPISEAKSLYEAELGEFAGRLITPDGVFQPRKFLIPNSGNLLQYLDSKIPTIDDATSEAEFVSKLDSILGENPSGLSLDQRMKLYNLQRDHSQDVERFLSKKEHLDVIPRLRFYVNDYSHKIQLSRHYVAYWLNRCAEIPGSSLNFDNIGAAWKPARDFLSSRTVKWSAEVINQWGLIQQMHAKWYNPHETCDPIMNQSKFLGYINQVEVLLNLMYNEKPPWWARINTVYKRELELAKLGVHEAEMRLRDIRVAFLRDVS